MKLACLLLQLASFVLVCVCGGGGGGGGGGGREGGGGGGRRENCRSQKCFIQSRNGIGNESCSLVLVSFLDSQIFELFAVKSQIFKRVLGILVSLGFTIHLPFLGC